MRNSPAPAAVSAARPAFEAVAACETVLLFVGTCFSMSSALISRPPTTSEGTVHSHCLWEKWRGAVQRSFWSRTRFLGSDLMSTGGGENWLGCEGAPWEVVFLSGDGASGYVCGYATTLEKASNQIITMRATAQLDIRIGSGMPTRNHHVSLIEKD